MPNPLRFTPIEAMHPKSLGVLPTILHIGNSPVYFEALLIRLLTGTLDIECNLTGDVIKQRTNFSKLPAIKNKRISSNTIKQSIIPYKLSNLREVLLKTNTRNYRFYKELYSEFAIYFFRRSQKNEIAAFIHLYRILELIAYTFPLTWAAKANDYIGTFTKLKKYFNGEKTGELKMFQRFIDDIIPAPLLNVQIKLEFNSIHTGWQEGYFRSIRNNIYPSDGIVSYTEFSEIVIKTRCLVSLMINIRNHYFHFLSGDRKNFDSEDIVEANELFLTLNDLFANWLSVIYFEILDNKMN